MADQTETEETLRNQNSNSYHSIIGLIIVAALVVVIFITLAVVLGFARCMKYQKNEVPTITNEAYGTALQDTTVYMEGDTYDYPSMDDPPMKSINTKQNEAYATNAEAKRCVAYAAAAEVKQCVAYATNITTERNDAYGIRLQDIILQREGDTYD